MRHALFNANTYTIRSCVGKSDGAYSNLDICALGQCTRKVLAADCTLAVLSEPEWTVVYSSDRLHPLYDMIYKVGNIFYVFQISVGGSHDAKQTRLSSGLELAQKGRN